MHLGEAWLTELQFLDLSTIYTEIKVGMFETIYLDYNFWKKVMLKFDNNSKVQKTEIYHVQIL